MKKIAVVSDFHCGHAVGLTPPNWQHAGGHQKAADVRKQCWDFYESNAIKRGPFDVVIANADLIDGKGERSDGVELIEPDRLEQVKMAEMALRVLLHDKTDLIMTYGTPYHTGTGEDFESVIANNLNAKSIGNIAHVEIEGVIFEAKHHVGGSQVPHTRHTAVARERLWNVLWNEAGISPKANVILRSHVHYFTYCGGSDWVAMTTPALQGLGSRFGARRMSGVVDFGFITFTVEDGKFEWEPILAKVEAQKSTLIVL